MIACVIHGSRRSRVLRRRAAFHSEDEYRLAERRPLARTGDWTSHPEVRDAESAIRSTERLVRLAHMQSIAVGVGIDRDRRNAHAPRRPYDPAGDFAAIGYEYLAEHLGP